MAFRENVRLDGIPFSWDTNLDDGAIRALYGILLSDPSHELDTTEDDVDPTPGKFSIPIQIRIMFVAFKEGACNCTRMWNHIIAIYKTHAEWQIWASREHELLELREEQRRQAEVEALLFDARDTELKEQIVHAVAAGDADKVSALLDSRLALRNQQGELRRYVDPYEWNMHGEVVEALSHFPDPRAAVAFFKRHSAPRQPYFMAFAEAYANRHRTVEVRRLQEIGAIFQAAIEISPLDGRLHKRIALFWRRRGEYQLAIEVCRSAISKGLRDGTRTGFEGRLARLLKAVGKDR